MSIMKFMPTRIITLNLNGIRSAAKKGFFNWLATQNADVVCLQETKWHLKNVCDETYRPKGYFCYFSDAAKPGYSGVGIYSKIEPTEVNYVFGWTFGESEGRFLEARFASISVISLYMPSGTSGEIRQAVKYEFLQHFLEYLKKIKEDGRQYIICGDWNIAHRTIDLKNWRANQKYTGFLPDERAWLTRVLDEHGWVDAFRVLNQNPDQYTWWSRRGQARTKNVGWRIDYQIVSPGLRDKLQNAVIYTGEIFSDHAPLIIDYDFFLNNF